MRDDSTLQDLPPKSVGNRHLRGRRIVTGAVALVVLLGLANALGVRSGTASATQDGWTVEVTYPAVARSGLDVPLRIEVSCAADVCPEGLGPKIDLALDRDYFQIYESQRFFPEPSGESSDEDLLYFTFDAPEQGSTLVVTYDAYIQPSSQIGHAGLVEVLVDDVATAPVRFRTVLLP